MLCMLKDQALCLIIFSFLLFSFYKIDYLSISMYLPLYFLRKSGRMRKKYFQLYIVFLYICLYIYQSIYLSIFPSLSIYLSLSFFIVLYYLFLMFSNYMVIFISLSLSPSIYDLSISNV